MALVSMATFQARFSLATWQQMVAMRPSCKRSGDPALELFDEGSAASF